MLENHDFTKSAPGILGAVSAMLWLRDTGIRRVGSVLLGSAASYYGTPFGLKIFDSLDGNLMGFLIGLFGMAVAAKIFEALDSFPTKVIVEKLLARIGL